MPQNYQFVENLIQLRQHYQSLSDDAERDSIHATEQLNHVNALLVDQLVEDQQFTESLMQLRSRYQALHQKYQQQANNAKQQLIHVNALLADSLVILPHEQQPISIQAATLEQQALIGAMPSAIRAATITDKGAELQRQEPELAREPKLPEISRQVASDISQGEHDQAIPTAVCSSTMLRKRAATIATSTQESPQPDIELPESSKLPQVSEPKIPSKPSQVEQQPEPERITDLTDIIGDSPSDTERSPFSKPATSPSLRQAAPLKTPLLPQYQHLTKSEAIEKLLHEHSGTILHVDYIIRALYGELTEEDIAAEKPRLNDSLKKGVAKGLWDRVPDEAGCYTADIKLVDKEEEPKLVEAKKRQPRKPNSKATEGMLPRYRNLTFTEAVETVMRDRSGEIVTTDLMARALYGELEGKALTEAKTKVGKTLWSGANQGRWQSVPRQAGAYTLDVSKLR